MDQKELRERAVDLLRNEYGLVDVVQWFDRGFLQGYTDALVRVFPYPNSVYFRIYDGGYVEEITFEIATNSESN